MKKSKKHNLSRPHGLDRALENIEHIRKTNPDRYNRIINRCWATHAKEIVGRLPSLLFKKDVDTNLLSDGVGK